MIAIVDYGVGNLFSLCSSFAATGIEAAVTSDPAVIAAADGILLPGVGAFEDAARKLRESGLGEVVKREAAAGKPLLGICLGMQLLFERSYEYGEHEGLGLIPGSVRPIADVIPADLKIPHIGWNPLNFVRRTPIFKYVREGDCVYFVHSYYAADCGDAVTATAEYGAPLTASVQSGNVFGCQFHPEKSGSVGLGILRAFGELCDARKKPMTIFPAIDLVGGKAVRLLRGDYAQMTVYSDDPAAVARDFAARGATAIHIVDLEGARDGGTPNLDTVLAIKKESGLFCEIGGGVRTMEVVDRYLGAGIDRVILGTAALEDEAFLRAAVEKYGDRIAVGADIRNGFLAVKGWTERSQVGILEFCEKMVEIGVKTLICTDISKDGAMRGTNRALYAELSRRFDLDITASGGVSSLDDVRALRSLGLYGAIIGKAYYTGAIDLGEALEAAK